MITLIFDSDDFIIDIINDFLEVNGLKNVELIVIEENPIINFNEIVIT